LGFFPLNCKKRIVFAQIDLPKILYAGTFEHPHRQLFKEKRTEGSVYQMGKMRNNCRWVNVFSNGIICAVTWDATETKEC